jgi:hypothetical protein
MPIESDRHKPESPVEWGREERHAYRCELTPCGSSGHDNADTWRLSSVERARIRRGFEIALKNGQAPAIGSQPRFAD